VTLANANNQTSGTGCVLEWRPDLTRRDPLPATTLFPAKRPRSNPWALFLFCNPERNLPMHVIRDRPEVAKVQPDVRCLIEQRVSELAEFDVEINGEYVFFVVVEPGDALADVDAALGFPILRNRFNGAPYGAPDFTPSWDVLEEHTTCYELIFVLGDDGHGVQVFVPKQLGIPADLLEMCAHHAVKEQTDR
jgi:hypothetical protein